MKSLKTFATACVAGIATFAYSTSGVMAQTRPMPKLGAINPPIVNPAPATPKPVPATTPPATTQPANPRPGTTPPANTQSTTQGNPFQKPIPPHHRHRVFINNYFWMYGSTYPYASPSGYGAYASPGGGYSSSTRQYDDTTGMEPARQPTELERLARYWNNPQPGEIQSGKALNEILADLQKIFAAMHWEGLPAVNLPVKPESLVHVNVTQGAGNIGILKQGERLSWPTALSGPEFEEQRDHLEALIQDTIKQVKNGTTVDPDIIRSLTDAVVRFDKQIRQDAPAIDFETHAEAKTFIRNLDAAIVALQQPNAKQHLTGKYTLTAKTVFELVRQMTDNGLQFAPALPGEEPVYQALHQTLAAYDRNLHAQITAAAPSESQSYKGEAKSPK